MKKLLTEWQRYLKESVDVVVKKATDLVCPPATQDLELNTKNRDAAADRDWETIFSLFVNSFWHS